MKKLTLHLKIKIDPTNIKKLIHPSGIKKRVKDEFKRFDLDFCKLMALGGSIKAAGAFNQASLRQKKNMSLNLTVYPSLFLI